MRALLLSFSLIVLEGCAGANMTQLRETATFDLLSSARAAGQSCDESQISIRKVNNLLFAYGCGREARYVENCDGGCRWQLSDTVWPEGSHTSDGRLKPTAFGRRSPAGSQGDPAPSPPPAASPGPTG